MGAGRVTSDVPQVLQKRAGGVLLAPHLGHVMADIVCETNASPTQLLELTFELVCVWSRIPADLSLIPCYGSMWTSSRDQVVLFPMVTFKFSK